MSEIYKKFCNSMDAYPPEAAFATGVVGTIIFLIPYIMQSISFIPAAIINNFSPGLTIIGLILILVPVFRLAIYPLLRF